MKRNIGKEMTRLFEKLTTKKTKEIRILRDFISVFCQEKHPGRNKGVFSIKDARLRQSIGNRELQLCQDCQKLLHHGIAKLLMCPYDPKPTCKKCQTHCYAPGYRDKIRQVMKFSGMYLIKHGRVNLIMHYFL